MLESIIKNYDELPLFLNAKNLSKVLGLSESSVYELMHEKDFPSICIGRRLVVPKEHFKKWVDEQIEKKSEMMSFRLKSRINRLSSPHPTAPGNAGRRRFRGCLGRFQEISKLSQSPLRLALSKSRVTQF